MDINADQEHQTNEIICASSAIIYGPATSYLREIPQAISVPAVWDGRPGDDPAASSNTISLTTLRFFLQQGDENEILQHMRGGNHIYVSFRWYLENTGFESYLRLVLDDEVCITFHGRIDQTRQIVNRNTDLSRNAWDTQLWQPQDRLQLAAAQHRAAERALGGYTTQHRTHTQSYLKTASPLVRRRIENSQRQVQTARLDAQHIHRSTGNPSGLVSALGFSMRMAAQELRQLQHGDDDQGAKL